MGGGGEGDHEGELHLRCGVNEHHRLRLAAQRVLQQLSQLAVAEGHVGLLGCQSCHDIPQGCQAAVDVLRLLEPLPHSLAPPQPLTAWSHARERLNTSYGSNGRSRVVRSAVRLVEDLSSVRFSL